MDFSLIKDGESEISSIECAQNKPLEGENIYREGFLFK